MILWEKKFFHQTKEINDKNKSVPNSVDEHFENNTTNKINTEKKLIRKNISVLLYRIYNY